MAPVNSILDVGIGDSQESQYQMCPLVLFPNTGICVSKARGWKRSQDVLSEQQMVSLKLRPFVPSIFKTWLKALKLTKQKHPKQRPAGTQKDTSVGLC